MKLKPMLRLFVFCYERQVQIIFTKKILPLQLCLLLCNMFTFYPHLHEKVKKKYKKYIIFGSKFLMAEWLNLLWQIMYADEHLDESWRLLPHNVMESTAVAHGALEKVRIMVTWCLVNIYNLTHPSSSSSLLSVSNNAIWKHLFPLLI